MLVDDFKAHVFLSCGQQKGSDEIEIARAISKKLGKMGFSIYIAVEEQTLEGVVDNIFSKIEESEYFVFIDFKREELVEVRREKNSNEKVYRGGLFSQEELAVATFLDKPVIAFQEKSIKPLDGILQFIQANSFAFDERSSLPAKISKKIKENGWNPKWRDRIVLEKDPSEHEDAIFRPIKNKARWYHIKVKNIHRRKIALNCIAYLRGIRKISGSKRAKNIHDLVELKWKGVKINEVTIPAKEYRNLDAFYIVHVSPSTVYLSINQFLVDFTGYYHNYMIEGPGTYELEYVIYSSNFASSTATFVLSIGKRLDSVRFFKKKSS
jgi:hypothetical protein